MRNRTHTTLHQNREGRGCHRVARTRQIKSVEIRHAHTHHRKFVTVGFAHSAFAGASQGRLNLLHWPPMPSGRAVGVELRKEHLTACLGSSAAMPLPGLRKRSWGRPRQTLTLHHLQSEDGEAWLGGRKGQVPYLC